MPLLVGCLVLHALIAGIAPSPWWVPDLTVVGLCLAIIGAPRHWLGLSAVAGLFTMVWAIRFPVPIALGYLALGASIRFLAGQWDLEDQRAQDAVVAVSSAFIAAGLIWLDDCWSLRLVGWLVVRITMTILAALLVRRLPLARTRA